MATQIEGKRLVITPLYSIGDKVYHICKDSDEGIIIDYVYRESTGLITYTVALGFDRECYCLENELTTEKTF